MASRRAKAFWWWTFVLGAMFLLFGGAGYLYQAYVTNRDVVGYLDRAQVASDVEHIDDYLAKLQAGMRERGMTEGHAALVFATPQNDLGAMYRTVVDLREKRIATAKQMPRSSPEYQTALDDIRGICRELRLNDYATYFRLLNEAPWVIVLMALGVMMLTAGAIAYTILD